MWICHITNDLSRGGAESHLYSLMRLQTQEGHSVTVFLLGKDLKQYYSLQEDVKEIGVEIVRLKGLKKIQGLNPFSIFRSLIYFTQSKFDLIHSHTPRSDFLSFLLSFFLRGRFKWIVTVHGKYGTYLDGNKFIDILRKFSTKILFRIWQKPSNVIAISASIKDWILNNNNLVEPIVIPYGVEMGKEIETSQSKNLIIGYLGRINPNKGIEDLLKVFIDLKQDSSVDFSNEKLIIGGVGNSTYINKIKNKFDNSDIKYLGYIEDREKFFKSINLFVFPSYSEGLGLVLLEAMAHGVLCIARDIDPMNSMIEDSKTGYLFGDNNDLKKALVKIQSDPHSSKDLLINGALETIQNNYSIIRMYSKIKEVYNS